MAVDKELLKGSTTMLILRLLETGDMYGYQMVRELELRSEGIFTLKEGTLYPILHTLENNGTIDAYWEDTSSARKRKYYRITDTGRAEFQESVKEWTEFNKAVRRLLAEGGESYA